MRTITVLEMRDILQEFVNTNGLSSSRTTINGFSTPEFIDDTVIFSSSRTTVINMLVMTDLIATADDHLGYYRCKEAYTTGITAERITDILEMAMEN